MRQRLLILIASSLLGCVRNPGPPLVPVENDPSVTFPQFFESEAHVIGTDGQLTEIDGVVLNAMTIASADFLPKANQDTPCRNRREAQLYRVIRQTNIIFVYIHENPAYCGNLNPSLDSGVKYAISTDGRILRRVIDGQEGGPFDKRPSTRADAGFIGEPGSSPTFDALWNSPSHASEAALQDGGVPVLDAGTSPATPSVSGGGPPKAASDGSP